jgi:hypothetical protein
MRLVAGNESVCLVWGRLAETMMRALWAGSLLLSGAAPLAAQTIRIETATGLGGAGASAPAAARLQLAAAMESLQTGPFAPVQRAPDASGFRSVPAASDNGSITAIAAAKTPALPTIAAVGTKIPEVAGRYALLRAGGKDSGCMLTLDDKARGPHGSFKAVLAPGCGDRGILIFDPIGWQIEKGRLALIARAGQQTHLDLQADGLWEKDPKEGAPLAMKKI